MKVLIVDPDWRFAEQATEFLESHAHNVVHLNGSHEALDRAGHWKPDLVIVACEAAKDGLLEHLAALPGRPAVLLTGWADRFDRAWKAWQRGGDELLMKPMFSVQELHAGIVSALENAAAGTRRSKLAATA